MKFTQTAIPEVIICEPEVFGDERGYFFESFRLDQLEAFVGHSFSFCQDNESRSRYGVLRGLHFQKPPYTQTKLVRVLEGSVLDVAVDIRKESPTFGKHVAVELTGENKKQLLVPRGFAHGFVVLSETATFAYKCDHYYAPDYDSGILYKDAELAIDWKIPEEEMLLSEKDTNQPPLTEAELFDYSENLYD